MVSQVSQGSLPALPKNFDGCAETPAKKARTKRRTQLSRKENQTPRQGKASTEMEFVRNPVPSSDRGLIIEKMQSKKKLAGDTNITTASPPRKPSEEKSSLVEDLKKTEKKKKNRASQKVSGDGSAGRVDVKNGTTGEQATSTAQSKKKENRKKPMKSIGGDECDVHSISDLSTLISPSLRREKESLYLKARTAEARTLETSLIPKTIDLDQGDVPVQSTSREHGDDINGNSGESAYAMKGDGKMKVSGEKLKHLKQHIAAHIPCSSPTEVAKKNKLARKKKTKSTFEDKHYLATEVEEKRVPSEEKKLNSTSPEISVPLSSSGLKPRKKKIKKVSKKSDGTTSHTIRDGSTLDSNNVKQGASKATPSEAARLHATTRPSTASDKKISEVAPLVMEGHDSSTSVNRYATPPNSSPASNHKSTEFTSRKIDAPAYSSSPKLGGRRISVANYAKQRVSQSQQKKLLEEDGSATTFPSTIERNSDSAGGSRAKGKTSDRVFGKDSKGDPESPLTYNSGRGSSHELFQRNVGPPPLIPEEAVVSKHERSIFRESSSAVHQSKSNHSRTAFQVRSTTRSTKSNNFLLSWNPVTSVKQMLNKRSSEPVIATDVEVPNTIWYVRPETALADVDGRRDGSERVMTMTFYDTYTDESFKDLPM